VSVRDLSQRWREGCTTFVPPDDVARRGDLEVAAIPDDRTAREFVIRHHYARSYPAARFRFGAYKGGELKGVAVFSVPCSARVLSNVFPGEPLANVELGRLVLHDDLPFNSESNFVAECFRLLRREGIEGVLSFSDPVRRTAMDGRVILPGHVGTIYKGLNARYLGRATARTLRLLPDGTVFSDRAIQKIRGKERGWVYAVDQLVAAGAPTPILTQTTAEGLRFWLAQWLPLMTRPLKHGGNFKYAWALDRRIRRHLPEGLPYPKLLEAA
jgi:hypothetical protein